jgi:hypothetical protein
MPSRRTQAARPRVQEPPPVPAIRLIFEVDGDKITLLSQQPVDMAITGSDLAQQATAGTFVDARDANNRTLARVHARGAVQNSAEVFPEKHGDPILHVPVAKATGAFTVVIPAPKAAARVAVVRLDPGTPVTTRASTASASGAREATAPALQLTELASFDLQRRP